MLAYKLVTVSPKSKIKSPMFSEKTDAGLFGPQDLLGRSLDQKAGSSKPELIVEISAAR